MTVQPTGRHVHWQGHVMSIDGHRFVTVSQRHSLLPVTQKKKSNDSRVSVNQLQPMVDSQPFQPSISLSLTHSECKYGFWKVHLFWNGLPFQWFNSNKSDFHLWERKLNPLYFFLSGREVKKRVIPIKYMAISLLTGNLQAESTGCPKMMRALFLLEPMGNSAKL